MEQINMFHQRMMSGESSGLSDLDHDTEYSPDDIHHTIIMEDVNNETRDQLLTHDGIEIEDVDIELESDRDDKLANYIQSSDSFERDISQLLYSRVFELIPFIRSYLDLKPQMLL